MRLYFAACLALAGCTTVGTCGDGTIFLTVDLDSPSAAADQLLLQVTAMGTTQSATVTHAPGSATGSVEVRFPRGYPAGQSVTVTVAASVAGDVVGTGSTTQTLPAHCAAVTVHITGGGVGDLSAADDLATGDDLATSSADQAQPPDLLLPGDLAGTVGSFCSGDGNCLSGEYCDAGGHCAAQKAQGSMCNPTAGADCKNSNCAVCGSAGGCVDGYCCNSACGGSCQACNLGGSLGTCKPYPQYSSGRSCNSLQFCDGTNTTCQACATPGAAGALHFVDARGTNDTSHGGGYGPCGYKTVTYALTQASGQIALYPGVYGSSAGETMPIVLGGTQQLLCKYLVPTPATLSGKGTYAVSNEPIVVAFHGTSNALYNCIVNGGGGQGYCIEIDNSATSSSSPHSISSADISQCGGTAVEVDANVSNVSVSSSSIHNSLTGVFWIGTNTGSMVGNSFSTNTTDIQCQNADTGVTGNSNVDGASKPSCTTCGNCPF